MTACGGGECSDYQDLAAEYAVTDIDGRERDELVNHLDRCPACRHALREYTEVADALLELLPTIEPPLGFETRTLARLERFRLDAEPVPSPAPAFPRGDAPLVARTSRAPARARSVECPSARSAPVRSRPRRLPSASRPLARARRGLGTVTGHEYTRWTVLAVAIILIGALGWAIAHTVAAQPPSASVPTAAVPPPPGTGSVLHAPLTRGGEPIGEIYAHPGRHPGDATWLYLSLGHDEPAASRAPTTLTLQLRDGHGDTSTVSTFTVTDGYGAWAGPVLTDPFDLTRALLLEPDGTRYATAELADS